MNRLILGVAALAAAFGLGWYTRPAECTEWGIRALPTPVLCDRARAVFLRNIDPDLPDDFELEVKLFKEIRRRDAITKNTWIRCEERWYPKRK